MTDPLAQVSLVRRRFVDVLGAALSVKPVPGTPSTAEGGTIFCRPGNPYLTRQGGTWANPVVNLVGVLVAPQVNYLEALDWFDRRVELMHVCFDADPSLGGMVDAAMVREVSEVGLLSQDDPLLACRWQMEPMTVQALEAS